jgi:hypothetical protein
MCHLSNKHTRQFVLRDREGKRYSVWCDQQEWDIKLNSCNKHINYFIERQVNFIVISFYMTRIALNVIIGVLDRGATPCFLWGSIFVTFHHLSIPFKIVPCYSRGKYNSLWIETLFVILCVLNLSIKTWKMRLPPNVMLS